MFTPPPPPKVCLADAIHNFGSDKIDVNDFDILLIEITFIFTMFRNWYLLC